MKLETARVEAATAEAAPQTEDEVNAALMNVDAERAHFQDVLNRAEADEASLLERDGDERDFARHDMRLKNARRMLLKLDIRERKLVEAGAALEAAAKQTVYTEVRTRYIAASQELAYAANLVAQRIQAVRAISAEADRAGLSLINQPAFPPPGYSSVGPYTVFENAIGILIDQVAVAHRTPERLRPLAPGPLRQSVRFLEWTAYAGSAFQRGQIVAFPSADCRRLVAAKRAEYMRRGMEFDPFTAVWGAGVDITAARNANIAPPHETTRAMPQDPEDK